MGLNRSKKTKLQHVNPNFLFGYQTFFKLKYLIKVYKWWLSVSRNAATKISMIN